MFKKKSESAESAEFKKWKESFQEFLPIKDTHSGCFINANNEKLPVMLFPSINIDLMSAEDKVKLVSRLETMFGSLDCTEYQILVVPMPFDTSAWENNKIHLMQAYEDKLAFVDSSSNEYIQLKQKIQVLKWQCEHVKEKLQSGEMSTKKVYFIPKIVATEDIKGAVSKAKQLCNTFKSFDFDVRLASESELRELLYVLHNPLAANIECISRGPMLVMDD